MVISSEGYFYSYNIDLDNGGECSLTKQYRSVGRFTRRRFRCLLSLRSQFAGFRRRIFKYDRVVGSLHGSSISVSTMYNVLSGNSDTYLLLLLFLCLTTGYTAHICPGTNYID